MKKMTMLGLAAGALVGAIGFAPLASADPIVPPAPAYTDPPAAPQPPPPLPNVNAGTGDPAHNICVLTGHNC
jgi:hypothetical protein